MRQIASAALQNGLHVADALLGLRFDAAGDAAVRVCGKLAGDEHKAARAHAGGVRPDGGGGSFDPLHAVQLLSQRGCARDSSLASMAAGSFSLERKIMAAMM